MTITGLHRTWDGVRVLYSARKSPARRNNWKSYLLPAGLESVMQAFLGKYKHLSVFQLSLALFVLNVIGAVAYLRAVEPSWVIPEERAAGIHTVTGEPIVWAVGVLPFVVGFGLLNALWGSMPLRRKKWRSGYFWLATALIWLVAVWIDFAHH